MAEASFRELRTHPDAVVDRAASGEVVTITRRGLPIAELRASPSPTLSATELVAKWRSLPDVDPVALRADISATIDASA